MDNLIRRAEMEAYNSILRAFRYQSNELSWEKEMLLTDLRKELRISDDYHRDLLDRLNHDVTLRCIWQWRQGQNGSASYQHARHTSQPVHGPTDSPYQKKQRISPLPLHEGTRLQGVDRGIPYRTEHSGQGHDDDTTVRGAGRIRKVHFKPPSPQGVKGKMVQEDITLISTDTLTKEVERILIANPSWSLEVERAKNMLKKQEKALVHAIESLPDDSADHSDSYDY